MDNLPVKYQPRVGDTVRRVKRNEKGVVTEANHNGVVVQYSDKRIGFYPYRHDLEVVS